MVSMFLITFCEVADVDEIVRFQNHKFGIKGAFRLGDIDQVNRCSGPDMLKCRTEFPVTIIALKDFGIDIGLYFI